MSEMFKTLLLIIGVAGIVGVMHLVHLSRKDYASEFLERHGRLMHAELMPAGGTPAAEKFWLRLQSTSGLSVECGLLVPRQSGKRYPAIIVLGGKATGKDAVDFALDIDNVVIAAPDYMYKPRASYSLPQFLWDVPAIRRALLDMVPAVRLLTDYLLSRDDVDTTKLVLVGYSFGAPFIPCIIAHDRRAAAAAIVYGGGDLQSLIRHNVRRYEGPLISEFVARLGGLLLHPIEPLRYVGRIAPVPLIMINGTRDEQIPRTNVDLLYAAAREPKTSIWIESRHVSPANPELTQRIIEMLKHQLAAWGILQLNEGRPHRTH